MNRFICFVLFLLSFHTGKGQTTPLLEQDPAFQVITNKRIVYPVNAARDKLYTKGNIYAFFRINPLGHIQDIQILNPTGTSSGFDVMIQRGLQLLPPVKPTYAGEYILPVRFIYPTQRNRVNTDTIRPLPQSYEAFNDLLIAYPGITLLHEVKVTPWQ